MKLYTDEELHKLHNTAESRGDRVLAIALMSVAAARGSGEEEELHSLLTMFLGYLVAKGEAQVPDQKKGENHEIRDVDLTAIDPNMVVQF